MKIVYCLNSLGEIGGISKVTVTKINALAQIEGNKIYRSEERRVGKEC